MGELHCSLIEDEDEVHGFDCGNDSVNALVKKSFYRHLLRQALTYKVSIQGFCVGFYTVSVTGITFDDSDTHMADYFDQDAYYGAIKLDYLAVDVGAQEKGIGTEILTYIIRSAQLLYQNWPVRVLVLDALRSRVEWYMRRGFDVLNKDDLRSDSETVMMFLDLMPQKDVSTLEEYSSSFYS